MSLLRTLTTSAAAVALMGAAAGPASAWTASAAGAGTGQTVTLTAAPGERNAPVVTRAGNAGDVLRLADAGGAAHATGPACGLNAELQLASCVAVGSVRLVLRLGDRGDVAVLGDGLAGVGRLDLAGEDGADVLGNGGLPGTLSGGAGPDVLRPGGGADVVKGGAGSDVVDYGERTAPVRVDLRTVNGAAVADDGEAGEGDLVAGDVEGVIGGAGDDVLFGAAGPEQLHPGAGRDAVSAGGGDDVVDLRDGRRDTVTCGSGHDTVLADAVDVVTADCDVVHRTGGALQTR